MTVRYLILKLSLLLLVHNTRHSIVPLRVLGGKDADPSKYVYIVRLENKLNLEFPLAKGVQMVMNSHVCTCSALTPIWTLTAAHCIGEFQKMALRLPESINMSLVIRYGSVFNKPLDKNTFSKVLQAITHPNYRLIQFSNMPALQPLTVRNDVGLLRTEPIKLKMYGKIAALDYSTFIGQVVVLPGYGLMAAPIRKDFQSTLDLQKPLQVVNMMVKKCDKEVTNLLSPVMCLAPRCGEETAACAGDSGGPLVHGSGIIGVISMGNMNACNHNITEKVQVFDSYITPISPYLDWIASVINTNVSQCPE